jgi:hypothetical protein
MLHLAQRLLYRASFAGQRGTPLLGVTYHRRDPASDDVIDLNRQAAAFLDDG